MTDQYISIKLSNTYIVTTSQTGCRTRVSSACHHKSHDILLKWVIYLNLFTLHVGISINLIHILKLK